MRQQGTAVFKQSLLEKLRKTLARLGDYEIPSLFVVSMKSTKCSSEHCKAEAGAVCEHRDGFNHKR